jgi:hypothetical protein
MQRAAACAGGYLLGLVVLLPCTPLLLRVGRHDALPGCWQVDVPLVLGGAAAAVGAPLVSCRWSSTSRCCCLHCLCSTCGSSGSWLKPFLLCRAT